MQPRIGRRSLPYENTRKKTRLAVTLALAVIAATPSWAQEPTPPAANRSNEELQVRADEILTSFSHLVTDGRLETARARMHEALQLYQQAGDRRGEVNAWTLLAITEREIGAHPAAITDFEQAVRLLDELEDHHGAALLLWFLGQEENLAGRYPEAEAHLRRGLRLVEELQGNDEPLNVANLEIFGHLTGAPQSFFEQAAAFAPLLRPMVLTLTKIGLLDTSGLVLTALERSEEAEEAFAAALDAGKPLAGLMDGSVLTHLGALRRQQWRLDEARDAYRRAIAALERSGDLLNLRIAVGYLEELDTLLGDYDQALANNQRSQELARQVGDRGRQALLLTDRAHIHFLRGDPASARQALVESRTLVDTIEDPGARAEVLVSLGSFAMTQGLYEEAAAALEEAIPLSRQLGSLADVAPALLILGEVYDLLGFTDRMLARAQEAAQIAHQVGLEEIETLALLTAARTRLRLGECDEGCPDLDRLRGLLEKEKNPVLRPQWRAMVAELLFTAGHPDEAGAEAQRAVEEAGAGNYSARMMALFTLVQVEQQRGDLGATEAHLRDCLDVLRAMGEQELEAQILGALGALRWKRGHGDEGLQLLTEALDLFETVQSHVRVDDLLIGFLGHERHFLYNAVVEILVEMDRPEAAFQYSERARARAFLNMLGNRRVSVRGGDRQLVAQADGLRQTLIAWEQELNRQRSGQQSPEADPAKVARDLEEGRRRYADLLVRLKLSDPEYASTVNVDPVALEELQRDVLPPKTTLVSYFFAANHVLAWVIDQDSFRMLKLDVSPDDLRSAVRDELAALAGPARSTDDGRGVVLVDPGPPAPDRAKELYGWLVTPIRPHLRQGNRIVLVPHDVLHYLPFAALRNPETDAYLVEEVTLSYAPSASVLRFFEAKRSPFEGRALVLGDPGGKLRGAGNEARMVAASFGTEPVLGAAATESRVWRSAGQLDLLHLAAHVEYRADDPLFSRVLLAADGEHDGPLEVHEILGSLDLTGVDLVVLSGCETARGPRTRGDEIQGLLRAFHYAGSPAVLATLWQIDDVGSVPLIKSFYRHLLAGETAAEALRAAQLDLIRGESYSSPYYWAPFVLSGDTRITERSERPLQGSVNGGR